MTMVLLLWAPAQAADCPNLLEQASSALEAFDRAEVAQARAFVTRGYTAIACQKEVLSTEVLLNLYRVDALLSLTADDQRGMVYATLRSVAVHAPDSRPPDKFGPELKALHDRWEARMANTLLQVTVTDGGIVYVDGRRVALDAPLVVGEGEHVVQRTNNDATVRTEVRSWMGDIALETGIPRDPTVIVPDLVPDPVPDLLDPQDLPVPDPVVPTVKKRRLNPVALALGGAAVGFGAGSLVVGATRERLFLRSAYLPATFDGCTQDSTCYAAAREARIRRDGRGIDILYGVGYGLSVGGTLVFTAGLFGAP